MQVLAIPIIPDSGDLVNPAPIIVYTPEYDTAHFDKGPCAWNTDIPFATEFRLIHDIKVISGKGGALDSALVAGREGIVYLHYDTNNEQHGAWQYTIIGKGLPQEEGNPYWGSGSVDVCSVHNDDIAYIATCEVICTVSEDCYVCLLYCRPSTETRSQFT